MSTSTLNTLLHNLLLVVAAAATVAVKNPEHQQQAAKYIGLGETILEVLSQVQAAGQTQPSA